MSAGYGAVLVDEPVSESQHEVAGAVIFSGSESEPFAAADDPRFVVLRHPGGDYDLARTGYSWSDLLKQGRYVSVINVICRECGTVFPRRRLAAPGGNGCMSSLAIGIAIGIVAGIWCRSFSIGLLTWFSITLGISLLIDCLSSLYIRFRFSTRAASLIAEKWCPTCHADNARSIDRAKDVLCPICRHETLRFVMAGIS